MVKVTQGLSIGSLIVAVCRNANTPKEADTVQAGQTNQSIDDARNPIETKDSFDEVKIEKSNQPPIDSADDNQYQTDYIKWLRVHEMVPPSESTCLS